MAKTKSKNISSARSDRSDRAVSSAKVISPQERHRLIAEAAYYRAQRRGFQGGNQIEDWLQAEIEVDTRLMTPDQQKQDKLAYDKLHKSARKILDNTRDTRNPETIRHALGQAVQQLKQVGEYTADTVDRIAVSVEEDLVNATRRMSSR